ncbi:MAG: methylated-DNA--[protein]-cysteine S-methyltransferase [Thermotogota bacterium]
MINFKYRFYRGYFDVYIKNSRFEKINIITNTFYNFRDNNNNRNNIYFNLFENLLKNNKKIDLKYITLPGNSDFSKQLYLTLYQTNFGETLSYKELAFKVTNNKAYRAVGTLMKKNPLPIVIPCHRVIKNNGEIGNFGAGKDWKIALLNNEKKNGVNL